MSKILSNMGLPSERGIRHKLNNDGEDISLSQFVPKLECDKKKRGPKPARKPRKSKYTEEEKLERRREKDRERKRKKADEKKLMAMGLIEEVVSSLDSSTSSVPTISKYTTDMPSSVISVGLTNQDMAMLVSTLTSFLDKQLVATKKEISDTVKELDSYRKELDKSKAELEKSKVVLEKSKIELEETKIKLNKQSLKSLTEEIRAKVESELTDKLSVSIRKELEKEYRQREEDIYAEIEAQEELKRKEEERRLKAEQRSSEFKDISFWEPWYVVKVHSSGKVMMVPKTTVGKDGKQYIKFRGRDCPLDFVIASAFLANPYCCLEVTHKDGNVNNNSVSNLEWNEKSATYRPLCGVMPVYNAFYMIPDSFEQLYRDNMLSDISMSYDSPIRLYTEHWRTFSGLDKKAFGDDTVENCETRVILSANDGQPYTIQKISKTGAVYQCDLASEVYETIRDYILENERKEVRKEVIEDVRKSIYNEVVNDIYNEVKNKVSKETIQLLSKKDTMLVIGKNNQFIKNPDELQKVMLKRLSDICALSIDNPELFDGFLKKVIESMESTQIANIETISQNEIKKLNERLDKIEENNEVIEEIKPIVDKKAMISSYNMYNDYG